MLANLHDQRQAYPSAEHDGGNIHRRRAVFTGEMQEAVHQLRIFDNQPHHRHHHQHQPQRRGPHLQAGQGFHAIDHQREHHQGGDQISHPQRDPEAHQQALGHDRAFEGEEDKGEAGKNNAGDHRAEIAEAGAAGDQVKVNVVARGGDRQRNAGEEDHQRRHQDRIDGVAGAPGHTDAGADGKVGQIGDAAQRGDRDDARTPAAEAQRGVT